MKHLTITPSNPSQGSRLPALDYRDDGQAKTIVASYQRLVVWRPEHGRHCEAVAVPDTAERQVLQQRLAELGAMLKPAQGEATQHARIGAAVAEMLGNGGYSSLNKADTKAKVTGYVADLIDLPAWSVERACLAVRRGKVAELNPDFPPTAARLHQVAEGELAEPRVERDNIVGVLELKVRPHEPDEAERERVGRGLQRLAQELKGSPEPEDEAARAERIAAHRRRDELSVQREWGDQPAPQIAGVPISRELAGKLGAA